MASDKMLPITSEQPTESGLDVLTMSNAEIKNQISPTHVPPEKDFDANSLFVAVKRILKRFDNIFQDQKDLEILEEEASTDSLDPILGTVEQLSLEMTHKALDVETAHRTTMSILNKLSSYSWQTKAVLTIANFALIYKKYILATTKRDPLTQLIESMEISKHLTFFDKEGIRCMISQMLTTTEYIFELEKQTSTSTKNAKDIPMLSHAMDDVPVLVYWIIMTAVALLTLTFCLTSNEDKTQELLSFARSIYGKLSIESLDIMCCLSYVEIWKAKRRVKEFLQTPDKVTEVLKALIFGKDDVQSLIDSCLDEPVILDVLKNKGVLLFISDLHVSREDISVMKPIYEEITDYNIVWIPIVVQWTDELRKKFDMLRSGMPWYVLQYFSQLVNEPVVVADAQGDVQAQNVLPFIREKGTEAFPFKASIHVIRLSVMRPVGPHAIEDYTFYYGGEDSRWIKQFYEKVKIMAEDPITKKAPISVEFSWVKNNKWSPFRRGSNIQKKNKEIQKILNSFKNKKRWAVLIKCSTKIVSHDGPTILKVLEMFDEWKQFVSEMGFEICFNECHDKLCSTNPGPSTAPPV